MRPTLLVLALGAITATRSPADARVRDACKATTDAAFRACRTGALSDRLLAAGRCADLADAAARRTCLDRAASDAQDAAGGCRDQRTARQATCKRLGAAPYSPAIVPANFTTTIDNPLFPLVPGTTFVYEGPTADGLEHDEFAVTHDTVVILGVTCMQVHDTVQLNGVLTEDTLDWFAQDDAGNVWYFGENSKTLEDGLVTDLAGSWTGGVDGAVPGIVMEAQPKVGDFYRQEFLLGEAEDLAEVQTLDDAVTVHGTQYTKVLRTLETSPLEPDAMENKYYVAGVGNVLTVDLQTGDRSELIAVTTGH